MNIKKILVAVDGSAISLARLETAFNMARNYGASVSSVYVISVNVPGLSSGAAHGGWYIGDELLVSLRAEAYQAASEVQVTCERLAKRNDCDLNWIQKEGDVSTEINDEARYHDILLLGRPNTVNEPQVREGEINSILLGCGKPCLVIPGANPLLELAPRNIVFGWDGSREASQALMQSIPFLADAESVMVVTVHKHKEDLTHITESNRRITSYLTDHGVPASVHLLDKKSRTTAQVLANYAVESESDLLVMGAYGHSRFRETVLGGATKEMLLDAAIPVLYGH